MNVNSYRADIDGLRCVAVVSVLLSHLEIPAVSGGFVGVDIFFVISGYLITRIIARDLAAGEYSVLTFYERRARRILPALFAMLLATFAVAVVALGPPQFVSLARSAVATVGFVSNIWFWQSSSSYFGADVKLEPLLHTWSLGVEEQFYIIFPVLLWAAFRLARGRLAAIVAAVVALSFLASLYQVASGAAPAAFYLLPSRFWELGLGALLALAPPRVPAGRGMREGLAWLAVAAILLPVLLYDDATPFPGLSALPPVLGSALLIWLHSSAETPVGRVLASRPFVAIGLVSYSLYLWHWPVIVYAKVMLGPLTPVTMLVCGALSLGLAALSWRLVEQPFRGRGAWLATRPRILAASGAGIVATVAVAAVVMAGGGFAVRLAPATARAFAASEDQDPRSLACMGAKQIGDEDCRIGAPGAGPADFLLWGDSHAAAALPGVDHAAAAVGRRGYVAAFPACAPLLDVYRADQRAGTACARFNNEVLAFLEGRDDMPLVILAGRWGFATEGTPSPGEDVGPAILATVDGGLPSGEVADNAAIFEAALPRTIAAIRATGRKVVVLGDVPEIGWSVPESVGRSLMHDVPLPPGPDPSDVARRAKASDEVFRTLQAEGALTFVPLSSAFCHGRCDVVGPEGPLYRDGHHLSRSGAIDRLTPLLSRVLRKSTTTARESWSAN